MERKRNYCSQEQKNMLVELLRGDQQLLSGKFTSNFTFKVAQKRWESISNSLNAIPGGQKDWKQWRKTWQDIRSKVKTKKAHINKYETSTGGGPPPPSTEVLSECDEKILSVITPYVVVEFDFQHITNETEETFDDGIDNHEAHEDHIKDVHNTENKKNNLLNNINDKTQRVRNKKRTVAATRLLNSATATTILAETSKKELELKETYYTKKISLLERQTIALE